MTRLSHEEVRELLPAYTLGSVPDDEIRDIRGHILSCEQCMAEADEMMRTVNELTALVEPEEPPAGFAERVLVATRGQVEPTPSRATRRWSWRPVVAGLTSLALIAGLAFAVVDARSQLDAREEVIAALLHGEGFALDGSSGAVGKVVPTNDGAVFAVAGLQEAPGGHTYQLWLLDGDEPVSGGIFDAQDGMAVLEVDEELAGYDGTAVTVELAGGADQPTTDPILASTS